MPTKSLVIPNRAERPVRNPLLVAAHYSAQQYGLPLWIYKRADISAHGFLGHSRAEDKKLRKDPTFGGSLL
jgi:hypothetical protein